MQVEGSWKNLSMGAALAYRWDGKRSRLLFNTRPGSYDTQSLIPVLRGLLRELAGRVILIWDNLKAHISGEMTAWIAAQRGRLCVEQLPSYAPELNPVEGVWSSLKSRELANLCAHSLFAVRREARRGLRRTGRQKALPLNLLRRAGLFF